jgi:hypothetical protein
VRRILHGDSTGIPLHVILTDLPFGAWFMALYLDLFADAGSRRAAARLVGLEVVTSVPTALAGWAEWAPADSWAHGQRATGRPAPVTRLASAARPRLEESRPRRGTRPSR